MKKNCRNNGITMIALCVTIIVLLILAGVTISTFEGKDGIFNKANDSKKSAAIVEEKEILNTTVAASVGASSKAQVEEAYIRKYLNENVGNENEKYTLETDGDNFRIKFIDTGNEYVVSKDGNIYSNDEFNNELVLNPSKKLIVEVGEKETITASVTSVGSGVRWESEDETIAKIDYGDFSNDKEIKVIGVKNGTTKITAQISNGTQMTCEVTVQTSPKAITLNKRDVTLDLSIIKTEQLSVTYDPESSNVNRELTWTSSNPEVATVDGNGLITGKSNGTTEITAKTKNGKTDSCKVTIETSPIGISLNKGKDTLDLSGNKTIQLSVTYNPTSSNVKKNITWESSDTSRVTVDEKGLVTGKMNTEEGKPVKITAKTENGKVAFCYITVQTNPTSVTLNKTSETLDMSGTKTVQLTATVNPGTANINKKITWSSNNTGVATVNSSTGLVTAKANGSVTITARTENGKTASVTIKVQTSPQGISLNKTSVTLDMSGTKTVQLSVTAYNPTTSNVNKGITWSSSNSNIASVSTSGLVTAKTNGKATITATTTNGKTASCSILVQTFPTSVTLNKTSETLDMSGTTTVQLTATINPSSANINTGKSWSSSNPGVATVNSSTGLVTAKANGTATITVRTGNGKTASCSITVHTNPTSVSISPTSVPLDTEGIQFSKTTKLTAKAKPDSADVNTGIRWSSDNPSVATVDGSGNVKAVGYGTANIKATAQNEKMAQCSVTVTTSISGLAVSTTSKTLNVGEKLDLSNSVTKTPSTAREGITWTSSNSNVASVSNGVVIANSAGTATITVKSSSGNRSATCTITVIKKYSSSEINSSFYGSLVTNYQGPRDGGMKYRIFYADGTNVYLITDDYQVEGTEGGYTAGYFKNKSVWNFLNKGEFADYAQGAPTLEMYLSSYNQTHGTNITEENTDMGYSFLILNSDRVTKYEIPAIEDYNGIYLKLDKSKARAMSLASATTPDGMDIWAVGIFNEVVEELAEFKWTHFAVAQGVGIRPIICLNSSVKFQKNSDGSYTLSY